MRWGSYVAVGDSFTEGMNDFEPDGVRLRGWADLVAARLAREYSDAGQAVAAEPGPATEPATEADAATEFRYANLAIRGKLFDAIVDDQVPLALGMRPDLISFAGGGNDVLRRSFSAEAMVARFGEVIRTLRASGADVIVFRWADVTTRLPGKRLIMPRMTILNRAVAEVAEAYGARMVDLWHDEAFHNPRLWSEDRLHMSTLGHQRVAAHVLTALGLVPDPTWLAAPEPPERRAWLVRRGDDARWARQHLAPWISRRLRGTSSGDSVTAKRPTLAPFPR